MSGHGAVGPKGFGTRTIQALSLLVAFAVLFFATRYTPQLDGHLGSVAAVGFLLLAGTLLSELLETIGLPHLSGYLLAGIISGPHIFHLVDHHAVTDLSMVNTLALALIALAGGAELRIDTLRSVARSLAWHTLCQSVFVLFAMGGTFFLLSRFLPFTRGLGFSALIGVSLLWGVLAIARSPSACLGILSQTRARGPVATFSLAFVMTSDVIVVVVLALSIMLARPLVTGAEGFSMNDLTVLGHELLGSVAMGTTLGLVLAAYLRLVGRQFLLVLLALGFVVTDFLKYVHLDPLLTFMVAGFVVQNMTAQGSAMLRTIEQVGGVVFVVFFGTAGAHLDVPLLRKLWPIALSLCGARAVFTLIAARAASRLAGDVPMVRRWAFSSLVSQAGLALGIAVVIVKAFPTIGAGFSAMAIAAVAVNEMVGPILFKFALDRAGETHSEEHAGRASLAPPPAH